MESLMSTEWFPSVLSSFLSLSDLARLSGSSQLCLEGTRSLKIRFLDSLWSFPALEKLPGCWKQLHQNWNPSHNARCLLLGIHGCSQQENQEGLYRHPMPVMEFHLDRLSLDVATGALVGDPWKEVHTVNPIPNLGRVGPMVCSVGGSQIFYCGGQLSVVHPEWAQQRWLQYRQFQKAPSACTAFFNATTNTWRELPPMPQARSHAGIARLGTRIFLVAGKLKDNASTFRQNHGDSIARTVLCFDVQQEEWIDASYIQEFPGTAFANLAVTAWDDTTLIAAGGITNPKLQYEGPSQEVYALDTLTGEWTALPDLPPGIATEDKFQARTLPHTGGTPSIALVCGEQWAQLTRTEQGAWQWKARPPLHQYGLPALRLNTIRTNLIHTGNGWKPLPVNPVMERRGLDQGVSITDVSTGEALRVSWSRYSTPTVVSVPMGSTPSSLEEWGI